MQNTRHSFTAASACSLPAENSSIDLVVTSPPYPMVQMWDSSFSLQDAECAEALAAGDGGRAFDKMHSILDKVWKEAFRVLKEGGFLCINIGDAVRTLNADFRLYSNHSRIISYCLKLGLIPLPEIIWRKVATSPSKFMGSGTLPAGAYVTLEHEFILIFRKGGRRSFESEKDKQLRRESAFFWEERNRWFSDLWDFAGERQTLGKGLPRARSGAFPMEVPFRLINMFSVYGDTVLDPFAGTGTTALAALTAGRNSVNIELEKELALAAAERIIKSKAEAEAWIEKRIAAHNEFISIEKNKGRSFSHYNQKHGFDVVSGQESSLNIYSLKSIKKIEASVLEAEYRNFSLRQPLIPFQE